MKVYDYELTYAKPVSKLTSFTSDADAFYSFHNVHVQVIYSGTIACDADGQVDFLGAKNVRVSDRYEFQNRQGPNWAAVPGEIAAADSNFWLLQQHHLAKGFDVWGVRIKDGIHLTWTGKVEAGPPPTSTTDYAAYHAAYE